MKIYIAGPMTGIKDLNFPAFRAAADNLAASGYDVVNPVDINPDPNADWTECMVADLRALKECDAIYLLQGWHKSCGAQIEHLAACRLEKKIYYEEFYDLE